MAERKLLQTFGRKRESVPATPAPARPGPRTDQKPAAPGRPNLPWTMLNALPEELIELEAKIRARQARELPVAQACARCGFVGTRPFRRPAGGPCLKCNFSAFKDGGFYHDMTPKEIKAHEAAMSTHRREWAARTERRELSDLNAIREAQGLVPLTMEELRAEKEKQAARNLKAAATYGRKEG